MFQINGCLFIAERLLLLYFYMIIFVFVGILAGSQKDNENGLPKVHPLL